MSAEIIRNNDLLNDASVEVVGGKGFGLLKLARLSEGRNFEVPEFYIIPVNFRYADSNLIDLFEQLRGPLVIRSSSPYEDLKGYSFAGRFKSVLNVNDFDSFKKAIDTVLESAEGEQVKNYAQQQGITIDNRMAIIVQKMINPRYSGVCYSTLNPSNPRVIVEYVRGLSNEMMSGNEQGNIVSFDENFNSRIEYGFDAVNVEKVARVARNLEGVYGEKLDIEFAVSDENKLYIVQVRSVTDPEWKRVDLATLSNSRLLLEADIVRGSGNFTGPAFIFRSPAEMDLYCSMQNKKASEGRYKQLKALREFDRKNTEGYCLITDTAEYCDRILNENLSNLKALITVNYASRFSHPIKIVSEMGVFYLGILGRKDLLNLIETGDTISVASDQSKGVICDLIKKPVELRKKDLEGVEFVRYEDAIDNDLPHYEEVDDKLFMDRDGKVGVFFWDYNEENGVPTDVFYNLILMDQGYVLDDGEYFASEAQYSHPSFPSLLSDLLMKAKIRAAKLINQLPK